MWRCHPNQLYAVEVTCTLPRKEGIIPESRTLEFLELLPDVPIGSPAKTLEQLSGKKVNGERKMPPCLYNYYAKAGLPLKLSLDRFIDHTTGKQ